MRRFGGTAIVILACIAIWQSLYLYVGDSALASPLQTVEKLAVLLRNGDFWTHVTETGRAFVLALVIAVLGGISLGVILGLGRLAGDVAEPILVTLYSIPKIVLYPLVLLCFVHHHYFIHLAGWTVSGAADALLRFTHPSGWVTLDSPLPVHPTSRGP